VSWWYPEKKRKEKGMKQLKKLKIGRGKFLMVIGLGLLFLWPDAGLWAQAKRVVTLAPALTEIVFALDKGDTLVGNTKFCNYPEAAQKIPRIGGFIDVNLEVLINKKPDIIFLYRDIYDSVKVMEQRSKLVMVNHTNLQDLYDAINVMAQALDVGEKGKQLVAKIKGQLKALHAQTAGKKPLKTLLIIGRTPDKLSNMYIIGKKDFLNELMVAAGGVNAYQGDLLYPSISAESVVAMNPDVILELSAYNEGIPEAQVLALWKKYPFITAVKNGKITIIRDAIWLIPGPRVTQIAQLMHDVYLK
jgi:iron complex transport system substrate-binding protein